MRREARLARHRLMLGKSTTSVGEANGIGSKSATFAAAEGERLRAYIDELTREIDRRQGSTANRRQAFYPWA